MRARTLTHLSDATLECDLPRVFSQEDASTATVLVYLAEFDMRRLYLPAGYSSLLAYCVERLGRSEDSALKRIRAARTARRHPIIFEMVADGRLGLTGVLLLKRYLTSENAAELLGAAEYKTNVQIQQLVAERFPRSEELPLIEAEPAASARLDSAEPARAPAGSADSRMIEATNEVAVRPPEPIPSRAKTIPIAPHRFSLHLTMGASTHEKLTYAQELLSHVVPTGDLAAVLDHALDALIHELEKQKFRSASTRAKRNGSGRNPRYIPKHVRDEVWKRDAGQCTFVSEAGHRCSSRELLELDHIVPVARGGQSTVSNLRVRCRPHNAYEAERVFGAGFMAEKREESRRVSRAPAQRSDCTDTRMTVPPRSPRAAEVDPPPSLPPPGSGSVDPERVRSTWNGIHCTSSRRVRRPRASNVPARRAPASHADRSPVSPSEASCRP